MDALSGGARRFFGVEVLPDGHTPDLSFRDVTRGGAHCVHLPCELFGPAALQSVGGRRGDLAQFASGLPLRSLLITDY